MCKKNCIVLLGIVFLSFAYADSLSDILDNAKISYLNNDISKTLEYLNTAKNELEKITFATNVSEYETAEYSRLRNFPSRYKGKKIKLKSYLSKIKSKGKFLLERHTKRTRPKRWSADEPAE